MLVFRRKVGQAVMIGGLIEVQVLEICGSRVKLGFNAPPDVLVVRKELYLTQAENRLAAACRATDGLMGLVGTLRSKASTDLPGSAPIQS